MNNTERLAELERIEQVIRDVTSESELIDIFGALLAIQGGDVKVCKKIDQVHRAFDIKRKEIRDMRQHGLSDEKITVVLRVRVSNSKVFRALDETKNWNNKPGDYPRLAAALVSAAKEYERAVIEYSRLLE